MKKDLSVEIRDQLQDGEIVTAFELLVALHCAGIRDGLDQITIDRDIITQAIRMPICPEVVFPSTIPEFG